MQVEYAGIKATGGKLFIIISLLGTIGGGLWGGFELFKRYEDMEAKISKYVAPDLSGFRERIGKMETLIKEQRTTINVELSTLKELVDVEVNTLKELVVVDVNTLKELVSDAQETARDMRTDIKGDVDDVLDQISAIDKRSRSDGLETRQAMRSAEKEIRGLINTTGKRWDDKLTKVDTQIESLEKKLDKKIQKTLENPLAAMSRTK